MILLLILGFAFVFFREIPGLIRNRYWKELIVFSALLGIAFIISVLMIIGIQLPQVSTAINDFVADLIP